MLKKQGLAIAGFGLIVLGLWGWLEFKPTGAEPPPETAAALGRGTNRLAAVTVLNRNWAVLKDMEWADVGPTAGAFSGQEILGRRFLEETGDQEAGPVIYLRGLIALAGGDEETAAREFRRLDPSQLPVELLYGPWRVLEGVEPGQPNPFHEVIEAAAARGELAPLVAARVRGLSGRPAESLQNYLQSDPAEWTGFDVDLFRIFLENEAVRNDAGNLLLAAVRGGRLTPQTQPLVARLLLGRGEPPTLAGEKVRDFLTAHPEVQAMAEETLLSLMDDRRLFLEERYEELLAKHRRAEEEDRENAGETEGLIDETVILLVLAASTAPESKDFFQWSQELERRFPQPEVAAWLASLKPDQP